MLAYHAYRSLQPTLHVALKEWAAVCAALGEGRQIVLLRKGGIHERGQRFEVEHRQFLLFPTYLHQNPAMLKTSEHANLKPVAAEPDEIEMTLAAEAIDVIRLHSQRQMNGLDDLHVWTAALIDMRFSYKPANPLYLMLVRAYRLATAAHVRNIPAYAGCRSWVPLREAFSTAGAMPVLDDAAWEARRREVRALLSADY